MSLSNAASAVAGAVGIRGLAVVDEEDAAQPADFLHAMRQTGEGCSAAATSAGRDRRDACTAALAANAFCDIVRARAGTPLPGAGRRRRRRGPIQGALPTSSLPSRYQPCGTRSWAETMSTQLRLARRSRSAMSRQYSSSVADDWMRGPRYQPLLERRIVLDGAVAVEMVGRDIEQNANSRLSVGVSSIWNDDISMTWMRSGAGGSRARIGGADVAAHLRVPAGRLAGCARSAPWSSICRWCR